MAAAAVLDEIQLARGAAPSFDRAFDHLKDLLAAPPDPAHARRLAQSIALLLQASLAVRYSIPAVADLLCARLDPSPNFTYGTLEPAPDARAILERAWPC